MLLISYIFFLKLVSLITFNAKTKDTLWTPCMEKSNALNGLLQFYFEEQIIQKIQQKGKLNQGNQYVIPAIMLWHLCSLSPLCFIVIVK